MRLWIVIFVALLVGSLAQGQVASGGSERRPGESILRLEAVVRAPASDIYTALTTPEGLKRAWGVALAEVDFRVGGVIRMHYNALARLGDEGTIENTIMAFEPDRMLALKPSTPMNASDAVRAITEVGWTVIRLEPLGPRSTRVVLTGMGYGEGPLFDEAYTVFRSGGQWTLAKMKQSLDEPESDARAEAIAALLRSLVGRWDFEYTQPGDPVRPARLVVSAPPVVPLIVMSTELSDGKTMRQIGLGVLARSPESGEWELLHYDLDGQRAAGSINLAPDELSRPRLILEWTLSPGGNLLASGLRLAQRVQFTWLDDDRVERVVWAPPDVDGVRVEIARQVMRRVAGAQTEPGMPGEAEAGLPHGSQLSPGSGEAQKKQPDPKVGTPLPR